VTRAIVSVDSGKVTAKSQQLNVRESATKMGNEEIISMLSEILRRFSSHGLACRTELPRFKH